MEGTRIELSAAKTFALEGFAGIASALHAAAAVAAAPGTPASAIQFDHFDIFIYEQKALRLSLTSFLLLFLLLPPFFLSYKRETLKGTHELGEVKNAILLSLYCFSSQT